MLTLVDGSFHGQLLRVCSRYLLEHGIFHATPVLRAPGADEHMAIKLVLEIDDSFGRVEVEEGAAEDRPFQAAEGRHQGSRWQLCAINLTPEHGRRQTLAARTEQSTWCCMEPHGQRACCSRQLAT